MTNIPTTISSNTNITFNKNEDLSYLSLLKDYNK
jgi:hypothetical protein